MATTTDMHPSETHEGEVQALAPGAKFGVLLLTAAFLLMALMILGDTLAMFFR